MATSWTLAVILILCLTLGWRYHFRVAEHRKMITQLAQKAEKARLTTAYAPVNTRVVAPPGTVMPDESALPLGTTVPLRYDPKARTVPETTVVELLPLANASSVLTEAEQVARKYMDTPEWQDRLQFVFEPERVRKLMEDYYEVQHNVDPVMGSLLSHARFRMNDTEIVQLTYRSARVNGKLELMLRRTGSNRLVIDWESYVGYSEKSFADLAKTRPTTAVLVRGFVKMDDYYNFEFNDAQKHVSLKVTSPDGSEIINAYCPQGSDMARWVTADLGARPQESLTKTYTFWISYPDKAQSGRCANLVQIQAGHWLLLPKK